MNKIQDKNGEVLIMFHDMIADTSSNKKLNPIVNSYLSDAEN